MRSPFRYFNSSPEVIRLVVMMYPRHAVAGKVHPAEAGLRDGGSLFGQRTYEPYRRRVVAFLSGGLRILKGPAAATPKRASARRPPAQRVLIRCFMFAPDEFSQDACGVEPSSGCDGEKTSFNGRDFARSPAIAFAAGEIDRAELVRRISR